MKEVSDLLLDRYRLGELDAVQAAALEAALRADPALQQRLEVLQQEAQQFSTTMMLPNLAASTLQRAAEQRQPSRLWNRFKLMRIIGSAAAVSAAALIIFTLEHREDRAVEPIVATVRTKGESLHLIVRVKRDEQQWTYRPTEYLQPGDQLRFAIRSNKSGYLYVIGKDAAGHTTQYAPEEATLSVRISADELHELPGAFVLDDTPGPEQITVVVCQNRLSAPQMIEIPTQPISGCEVSYFVLRK